MDVLLVVLLALGISLVQAEIDLILEDCLCETNDEYIAPGSCIMEVHDDDDVTSSIDTGMEIIKELPAEATMKVGLKEYRMGDYSIDSGYNVEINFCSIFERGGMFYDLVVNGLGMATPTCPMGVGTYGTKNFFPDITTWPDHFPPGKYLADLSLNHEGNQIIGLKAYATLQ